MADGDDTGDDHKDGTGDDDDLLSQDAKDGKGDEGQDDGDDKGGDDTKKKDDAPVTLGDLKGLIPDIVKAATTAAEAEANRIADRRINQALDGKKAKGGDGKGDEGDDDKGSSGPDLVAQRGARISFKEYLDGELTFLGNQEKAFATDLGKSIIDGLPSIEDEDVVGRAVAKKVAETVTDLRKFYEQRTKAALKRRGMLKDSDKGNGNGAASGSSGGTSAQVTDFDKGAKKAAAMFGTDKK